METPLVVPKNCAILVPMRSIESETIRYIKNMQRSDDFDDEFDTKFGHSTDAKISDVLWLCSSMFSSCGKTIRVPQIMWCTNEDMPHPEGSNDHMQAFQKAKDLQQLKLDFKMFPMKMDFDGDLFYKELLCQLCGLDPEEFEFPTPQLNERILLQRMFCRGHNKRAISNLTVEISPEAKFGIGIYSLTRSSVVPKPVLMSRTKGDLINSKRSHKFATIQEDDGGAVDVVANIEEHLDYKDTLEPSQTIKYQRCGGENINFTPIEAYEIKQVMEPKIKVVGFKPKSILSDHHHIKPAYFLYPNDTIIKNSTVFYRALWERCWADDKVVICICTMRLKSNPRLVALVPQVQDVNGENEILRYDGFRMEFLPFAGDIRDLSEVIKKSPELDTDVSKAIKKVIGRLRLNFNPTMFFNPAVRKIYKTVEKNEFEESDDEEEVDSTMPNVDAQDERIEQFVKNLDELLEGFQDIVVAPKRKAESSESTQRKKVSAEDVNMELVLEKCQKGNTKDLSVALLKSYLQLKNLSGFSKFNKSQCIEKIVELN